MRYPGETIFEREMERIAPLFSCLYIKIPDVIITKDNIKKTKDSVTGKTKSTVVAHTRPCDAILVTPFSTFMIEAKFNKGSLRKSQRDCEEKVNRLHPSYYIINKTVDNLGKMPIYTIRFKGKTSKKRITLFKTNKIEELFRWFRKEGRDAKCQ